MTEEKKTNITEERENLCQAIKKIAWAYVLLHLNVNLGTINILPNWLAYIFILQALPVIGEEEPSVLLLRPLGKILALWEGFLWLTAIFGVQFSNYAPLVVAVSASLYLYFHFQLLTDLANMAGKYGCPEQGHLLNLRTVCTILTTFLALPVPWEDYLILTIIIVLVNVVVAVWILAIMFSMKDFFGALDGEHGVIIQSEIE